MELRNFFKKNNSKNTTQNEQDFYQKNTQKKFLKIFAAASLALITCATTLLATAPFGTSAASAAVESETASSANLAQEIAEYKADIASGKIKYAPSALGLDPENDPVIYTTSSGLEIKKSNATPTSTPNGEFTNTALNGYSYVTMGEYNGYAINWLICGLPKVIGETTTPAGAAINAELDKNFFHTSPMANTSGSYYDTTLAANNFRLISECVLGTSTGVTLAESDTVPANGYILFDKSDDIVLTKVYEVTLNDYISNDTLGLSSFSSIITQNLFCLPSSVAGNLLSTICYTIGTSTATTWWCTDGATYSQVTDTYRYNVYKKYYDATGILTQVHCGMFRYYYTNTSRYACAECNTYTNTAGIRPALLVKLT